MIYKKTLRWREPYGGWETCDTSLCNRIFHWEIAHEINKRNYYEYRILLNRSDWPELAMISLPETSGFVTYEYGKEFQDLAFLTVFDTENFNVRMPSKIDKSKLFYMFENDQVYINDDDHYYSDFGYANINHLMGDNVEKRPLSLIRLRDQFIEDLIKRNSYDTVGIHIRRNSGVHYDGENAATMPDSIRDEFWGFKNKAPKINLDYPFISDDKYFKIMDGILEINPEQKFYISTDLPYKYFAHYIERYGEDKILTRYDFQDIVKEHLINSGINTNDLIQGNVIDNVIDLFSLSFCKFLIGSDQSTWSEFAHHYRGQPMVSPNDDWESVVKPKFLNPDWVQPDGYYFGDRNLEIKSLNKIKPLNLS